MQRMFEDEKELIESIKDTKALLGWLNQFKEEGTKYFEEKKTDAFQYTNRLYQVTFDRAKKLGADISQYPNTLEATLN